MSGRINLNFKYALFAGSPAKVVESSYGELDVSVWHEATAFGRSH
jgi:hypothetical protein